MKSVCMPIESTRKTPIAAPIFNKVIKFGPAHILQPQKVGFVDLIIFCAPVNFDETDTVLYGQQKPGSATFVFDKGDGNNQRAIWRVESLPLIIQKFKEQITETIDENGTVFSLFFENSDVISEFYIEYVPDLQLFVDSGLQWNGNNLPSTVSGPFYVPPPALKESGDYTIPGYFIIVGFDAKFVDLAETAPFIAPLGAVIEFAKG